MGVRVTVLIMAASYRASPMGKYRSVSDGIYRNGALIDRRAFSTSPLKPGVAPTSCFSQVRHCRIRLFASAPGIKFVRNSCSVCSNVVPGGDDARHNSLRHHSWENNQAVHTVAKASRPLVGGAV